MGFSLTRVSCLMAWVLFLTSATALAQVPPERGPSVFVTITPCERAIDTRKLEAQLRIELGDHNIFVHVLDEDGDAVITEEGAGTSSNERELNTSTHGEPGDANATHATDQTKAAPEPKAFVTLRFGRCEPDAPMVLVETSTRDGPARRIELVDVPREDRARSLALIASELLHDHLRPVAKPTAVEEDAAEEPEPESAKADAEKKANDGSTRPYEPKAPPPKRSDAFEAGGEMRLLFSGDFTLFGPTLSYAVARASPFELSAGLAALTGTRNEEIGTVRAVLVSGFVSPRYHLRLPAGFGLELAATLALGEAFASGSASASSATEGSVRNFVVDTSVRALLTAQVGPFVEAGLSAGIGSMLRGLEVYVRDVRTAQLDEGFFVAALVLRIPLAAPAP